MNSPEILPVERQLENLIADRFNEVVGELASYYEQHGTFVNNDEEIANPSLLLYIRDIAGKLLRISVPYDNITAHEQDIAFRIAYEAFFFAHRASALVMPHAKPRVYVKGYFVGDTDEEKLDKIIGGGQNYLQHREHIDGLIHWFISELDPTVDYPQIAEAVASMTFNHIEDGDRELYISQQVAAYAVELESN